MISENFTTKPLVEECIRLSISDIEDLDTFTHFIDLDDQVVGLTRTKCYFGSERVWFICPACNMRIGMLYRPPLKQAFLCRHCHNLTYELRRYHRSRQESSVKAINKLRYRKI